MHKMFTNIKCPAIVLNLTILFFVQGLTVFGASEHLDALYDIYPDDPVFRQEILHHVNSICTENKVPIGLTNGSIQKVLNLHKAGEYIGGNFESLHINAFLFNVYYVCLSALAP
ncbi:hypothetical protein WJR50_31900 [Catalinimonas sp. 4WD22]|uniref:hypothetical protein n=1 Tax=Catalinimonas locisalis TaxID=3133978 RepID=UPI0031010F49